MSQVLLRLQQPVCAFFRKALRGFTLTIEVPPQYHPQIIGRRGVKVTEIRTRHNVNIQFPDRDDENKVRRLLYHKSVVGKLRPARQILSTV